MLVTGNVRHFPRTAVVHMSVLSPASFLNAPAGQ